MVSEEPDVHLPLALCCDGFFVTHTKDVVNLTPADMCLPPYDPYRSPVPCMDMECPPVRMMRDPFVMKSNYISYATHASWQQEIWAAIERSRKHSIRWLNGLIDTENIDQEIMIVASGTAVSQGREAIRLLEDEGIRCGLVKVKTLRPWPEEEIREATKNAKHIFVPEFNVTGWLAKEIRATIPNPHRVHARDCGQSLRRRAQCRQDEPTYLWRHRTSLPDLVQQWPQCRLSKRHTRISRDRTIESHLADWLFDGRQSPP